MSRSHPMRIRLTAERLLDFLVVELGAPVYNQAIQDARGFLLEKLEDLEGEFFEPDEPEAGGVVYRKE